MQRMMCISVEQYNRMAENYDSAVEEIDDLKVCIIMLPYGLKPLIHEFFLIDWKCHICMPPLLTLSKTSRSSLILFNRSNTMSFAILVLIPAVV